MFRKFVFIFFIFVLIESTYQLNLKKENQVRQANIPSTIAIAMDIPAFGLKGEEKWIDIIGANEKAISHEDYMKESNRKSRMNNLEGRKKLTSALFSIMSNSVSEENFKEEIERNKKELENYNKIKEKNEKKINFENVPQPFYNGAVHPNDLQPIYHNWNLVNDIHGKKNQTILPQNKLFPRKLISN